MTTRPPSHWSRSPAQHMPRCLVSGKVALPSRRLARAVAARYPMIRNIYRCEWCGGWHLTKRGEGNDER